MRARGLEAWPPELTAGLRLERRLGRDVLCYADRPASLPGLLARALDAEGYVAIRDRIKDMITRGGENVYCVEVEEVLCAHPAVLEGAVVGLPDPVYGERVKACLVARPGARLEVEDVRGWARARLARFKVPEVVEVLDVLPRNPNGKVMKALLRLSA